MTSGDFRNCRISSLALAKMNRHAHSGGSQEVMGVLLGEAKPPNFQVKDCFALPVEATETRVNAMGEAYEYIVRYMDSLEASSGYRHQVVGWYHSHPGYGCFLSQIDIDTQTQNQRFQDPFVAIVVDPLKTLQQGKTELGAFRTSNGESIQLNVEYTKGEWDTALVTTLDRKVWSDTLRSAFNESN